jgi:8-oxo-dGTP diphosphatase
MTDDRLYPAQPIVGVGAVIVMEGCVVLARRGSPPLEGQWSLPGGRVELGETLRDAVVREAREETGLSVTAGPIVETVDHIQRDADGRIQRHYVLVDILCEPSGGTLVAGSDVSEVVLADPNDLGAYHLTPKVEAVIRKAIPRSPSR